MFSPNNGLPQYPLRLPSYRSLHQERFHPYPSSGRNCVPRAFDPMQTVYISPYDDDFSLPFNGRPSFALSVITEENDEDFINLDAVVVGLEENRLYRSRRRAFVDLVIDFALAMRRKLHKAKLHARR